MPEHGPVVVLPGRDVEGGGRVGLAARVAGDHLHLAGVGVAAAGDVEVPHAVVHQLVAAALFWRGEINAVFK